MESRELYWLSGHWARLTNCGVCVGPVAGGGDEEEDQRTLDGNFQQQQMCILFYNLICSRCHVCPTLVYGFLLTISQLARAPTIQRYF